MRTPRRPSIDEIQEYLTNGGEVKMTGLWMVGCLVSFGCGIVFGITLILLLGTN